MTDMWASGCLLLEIARTGAYKTFQWDRSEAEWYGEDPDRLFPGLRHDEMGLLNDKQRNIVNDVARRCLSPDPKQRPTSHMLLSELSGLDWE